MEEHKGRRLPTGLKVADICLQYADNVEKFYAYDWRTDSKVRGGLLCFTDSTDGHIAHIREKIH